MLTGTIWRSKRYQFRWMRPSLGWKTKHKTIKEITKTLRVVKSTVCYILKNKECTSQLSNTRRTRRQGYVMVWATITVNRTSLLVFIDNVTYWQNQQDLLRICSDSAKHFKTDQTVQIVKWPKAYCKDNLGLCQLNFLKTKLKAKRPTYKQQSKVAYSKGLTETSGSLEPTKVWKTVLIFKIMLVYPNQFEPLKIREGCIKVAVIPENLMQYFCLIAWIKAESLDFNHILILWFRITVPFSKNIWMWVQCNSVQTCINNAQDKNAFTCWSRPYTWTFSPPPLSWISTGSSVLRSQWSCFFNAEMK